MTQETAAAADESESALRLLIVVEDSELGHHTAELGVAVASQMGAEVVFHVPIPIEHIEAKTSSTLARAVVEHRQACHDRVQPLFERLCALAEGAGVPCHTALTIDEEPAAAVQRMTAEHDCEMVVVGTQGRGALSQVLRASLANELVRESARPVLVCRETTGFGRVAPLPEGEPAAKADDERGD